MINKINSANTSYTSFGNSNNSLNKKKKAVILAASAAGMTPVMMFLAARKGFSLNPAKIIKTPVKEWALFKSTPKSKAIQFEAPQIIAVATGSVLGGFAGGALVDDKSNLNAKKREILNQILGNVLVPVTCVWSGSKLYAKYADKIEGAMPQIRSLKKFPQFINKCLQKVPNGLTTLGLLALGIYLGNKVSNLINEKIYHKKVDRGIKATDFAPHVDDVCMAVSVMNNESSFGAKLGRIIPLALLVPGYQTGIAQDK